MLAVSNLQGMSEPLFTCFVLGALVVAAPLLSDVPKQGVTTSTALKAGALLALATLDASRRLICRSSSVQCSWREAHGADSSARP